METKTCINCGEEKLISDFYKGRSDCKECKLKNKLESFNSELSEWENMKNNGYDRIWDCGNYVFYIQ